MYNNLLKRGYGFFLNETEEKRVIDTNELAARRLEELQAAVRRQAAGMSREDGEFAEGFVQGLDAVDVSGLLDTAEGSGAVIKAEAAREKAQDILEDANARAQEILEDARVQAEQIMQDAQGQAQDLKRIAAEEGRMSGYREGKEKAEAEAEGLRRQLKAD